MRSKTHLEMNKTIMSEAHKEGGDLTASEHLVSAFLTLGITETSGEAEPGEPTTGEMEPEPTTYKAALRRQQASKWKDAMRQEWQVLIDNHTFDIVPQGKENTHRLAIADIVEEPIGCKWIYKRKINPDGSTLYKARLLVIKGY